MQDSAAQPHPRLGALTLVRQQKREPPRFANARDVILRGFREVCFPEKITPIEAANRHRQRQAAIGARNRELALSALRERDAWIARAEAAETRTARRSAEAEAAECERVADALYRDGF